MRNRLFAGVFLVPSLPATATLQCTGDLLAKAKQMLGCDSYDLQQG